MSSPGRIQPLPAEVAAQIHSSATINTLQDVVLGLLRNSLDAGAKTIEIFVDFSRGGCIVEDNGCGIPAEEFNENSGLGKLYFTSKHGSPVPTHGQNGTFLASLSALAILAITSRHYPQESSNALVLHRSKPIARLTPVLSHDDLLFRDHGTRVIVRDLFGNMPVRVKHRAVLLDGPLPMEREMDSLKLRIISLLLAWGQHTAVVIRDRDNRIRYSSRSLSARKLQPPPSEITDSTPSNPAMIKFLLSQASCIPAESLDAWIPVSGSTSFVSVNGLICARPAPTRRVQFLSFGISPVRGDLGRNVLYEQINSLFAASSFGTPSSDSVHFRPKVSRRIIDRWPMFYLRIDINTPESNNICERDLYLDNQALKAVSDVIGALVNGFLKAHGYCLDQGTDIKSSATPYSSGVSNSSNDRVIDIQANIPLTISQGASPVVAPTLEWSSGDQRAATGGPGVGRWPRSVLESSSTNPFHGHDAFSHWSRIKSGKDVFGFNFVKNQSTTCQQEVTESAGSRVEVSPSNPKLLPFIPDSDGDASFETVSSLEMPLENTGSSQAQSVAPGSEGQPEDDEMLAWENPATGETYLVNARSGMAVPRNNPGRPHSAPLLRSSSKYLSRRIRCSSVESGNFGKEKSTPSPSGQESWLQGIRRRWQNPVFQPPETRLFTTATRMNETICSSTRERQRCLPFSGLSHLSDSFLPADNIKLSRAALKTAQVISQVDGKFILVKLKLGGDTCNRTRDEEDDCSLAQAERLPKEVLVCIDQHAADERCRLEALFADLCTTHRPKDSSDFIRSNLGYSPHFSAKLLEKPIAFGILANEEHLFRASAPHLARWGIVYDLVHYKSAASTAVESTTGKGKTTNKTKTSWLLSVIALPPTIAERCRLEPDLLLDLVRAEVYQTLDTKQRFGSSSGGSCSASASASGNSCQCHPAATQPSLDFDIDVDTTCSTATHQLPCAAEHKWLTEIGSCPRGILALVTSRACRSAIMFNDKLAKDQCERLVERLAECVFPFQCAHGRPSMVPLTVLDRGQDQGRHTRVRGECQGQDMDMVAAGGGGQEQDQEQDQDLDEGDDEYVQKRTYLAFQEWM